jgi:hypothetical protein
MQITELDDTTVQGIVEANEQGLISIDDELDECILASAQHLATQGWWMWLFCITNGEASVWRDLERNFWVVDPKDGDIWEWGS